MRRPGAMPLVLKDRLIPSVPVTLRVFYGHRLALARGKPYLAGKWEDVTRHESFEWSTKRDAMRIALGDRHLPYRALPLAETEGYKPADFDRRYLGRGRRQRGGHRRKHAARGDARFHALSAA
jgi:hypothetical protein